MRSAPLSTRILLIALVFFVRYGSGDPAYADVVFPPDSGVVDVSRYGALPDDDRDDTAAIQKALDEHPSGNHLFFFPRGEYRISATLRLHGGKWNRVGIFQFSGDNQPKIVVHAEGADGYVQADAVRLRLAPPGG